MRLNWRSVPVAQIRILVLISIIYSNLRKLLHGKVFATLVPIVTIAVSFVKGEIEKPMYVEDLTSCVYVYYYSRENLKLSTNGWIGNRYAYYVFREREYSYRENEDRSTYR